MSKSISNYIYYLLTSWLTAVTLEYLMVPKADRTLTELSAVSGMSLLRVILITAILLITLIFTVKYIRKQELLRWFIVFPFVVYVTSAVINSFSWSFFIACLLIALLLIGYAAFGRDESLPKIQPAQKEKKLWYILLCLFALSFFFLISAWTVARVRTFSTPTYDFGIFSQMFHNMKETGLPMTTVERDGPLSHFAVHVSPIYYLMLPFYMIVPRPETLQVLQAAVITSAVIPLWKIGKQHRLHPGMRLMLCVLLMLYPAYAGGVSYDLHENCFLTPLLLWLFYGIDKNKLPLIAVFGALTLTVKEDAAVYVAVIALYLLLRSLLKRDTWGMLVGGVMMLVSVLYFLTVTSYLAYFGDGVMSGRYDNFMPEGSTSLMDVIKTILLCPIKVVYECVDLEKLTFIGFTLLPLLGLPLITRKYERLILLIPYLLVNLMSDYPYQHDIWFQYTFGSIALLFYLTLINLADINRSWKRYILLGLCLSVSFGCFYETIPPRAEYCISACIKDNDRFQIQRDYLNTIPDDVSVATTAFYTTYLSNREILYDIRYSSEEHILSCEYVVLKIGEPGTYSKYETDETDGKDGFVKFLISNGYYLEDQLEGVIEIYRRSVS